MNAQTRRSLNSLLNNLRSSKNTHRLEDIGIILDALAELTDVKLFTMFHRKKDKDARIDYPD